MTSATLKSDVPTKKRFKQPVAKHVLSKIVPMPQPRLCHQLGAAAAALLKS
jgi:hypothetical protein